MTVLQLSFMGTVMIGCIALLRKIAGRRLPQQCYLGLWLLAGLRLLPSRTVGLTVQHL